MRKVSLYYVIGFSIVSEILSFAALISVHSFEAALIFQIPAWLCFYRILCYLFPTHEGPHPLLAFLRIFGKHP